MDFAKTNKNICLRLFYANLVLFWDMFSVSKHDLLHKKLLCNAVKMCSHKVEKIMQRRVQSVRRGGGAYCMAGGWLHLIVFLCYFLFCMFCFVLTNRVCSIMSPDPEPCMKYFGPGSGFSGNKKGKFQRKILFFLQY